MTKRKKMEKKGPKTSKGQCRKALTGDGRKTIKPRKKEK